VILHRKNSLVFANIGTDLMAKNKRHQKKGLPGLIARRKKRAALGSRNPSGGNTWETIY